MQNDDRRLSYVITSQQKPTHTYTDGVLLGESARKTTEKFKSFSVFLSNRINDIIVRPTQM